MKAVFIYCGHDQAYYYSLLISVSSVRITNPNVKVVLVTDNNSFKLDKSNIEPRLFDEILFQIPEFDDNILESRNLKTSLGNIIDGKFIFFDNDTLIRRKLDCQDSFTKCDLMFARNMNRDSFSEQINSTDLEILNVLNISECDLPYFNSGVIYSSGSNNSKLFFKKWNEEWRRSLSITGKHVDQPALYSVLSNNVFNFDQFDDRYNCQLKSRFWFDFFSPDRKKVELESYVWHFFLSINEREKYTEFEQLCQDFIVNRVFSFVKVQKMLKRKSPWRRVRFLDFFVQSIVFNSNKIGPETKSLLLGDFFPYLKGRLKKFII